MAAVGTRKHVERAQQVYGLPGIHSNRTPRTTPRAQISQTTTSSLFKSGDTARAPARGEEGEVLDFSKWVSDTELNDVRWRLAHERKWQQKQEQKRRADVLQKMKQGDATSKEIQKARMAQKGQTAETNAERSLAQDISRDLQFKEQLKRAEATALADQLEWQRRSTEEQRRLNKLRAEEEKEELATRVAKGTRPARATPVVAARTPRAEPSASAEALVRRHEAVDRDEAQWRLEMARQSAEHDAIVREQQLEEQKAESRMHRDEVLECKTRSKVNRNIDVEIVKRERHLANEAEAAMQTAEAQRHAEILAWRKAYIHNEPPSSVDGRSPRPPEAVGPSSAVLRERFLHSLTPGEKALLGKKASTQMHKPSRNAEPISRKERLQTMANKNCEARAVAAEETAALEQARNKVNAQLTAQYDDLWQHIETAQQKAFTYGEALNAQRAERKARMESTKVAKARRHLAKLEAAQQRAAELQSKRIAETEAAADKAEAQAQRVAEELERQRKERLAAAEIKARETSARITRRTASLRAQAEAAYQENMQKLKADEEQLRRFEREKAEAIAAEATRRRQRELMREQDRSTKAEAALEKARAVAAHYERKEKLNQEKTARVLRAKQAKKSETESRLAGILATQAEQRETSAREFYAAEEAARIRRAEALAQADREREVAVLKSIRHVEQLKAGLAEARAKREQQAEADRAYAEERVKLAEERRQIVAERKKLTAAKRKTKQEAAWRRAREDRAQAAAIAKLGMLKKGKRPPTEGNEYDKPMPPAPHLHEDPWQAGHSIRGPSTMMTPGSAPPPVATKAKLSGRVSPGVKAYATGGSLTAH